MELQCTIANMNQIPICLLFCVLLIPFSGCGPEVAIQSDSSHSSSPKQNGDIMDVSTWDSSSQAPTGNRQTVRANAIQQKDQYAIVVATFTGDASTESATAERNTLARQYPSLGRGLTIRPRSRGTALTFGIYESYEDSAAKKDMAILRSMKTPQGKLLFGQILLLKFKPPRQWQNLHPYDLWTVRREFPKIVPLFTLEVAVWGDFESGQYPTNRRHAAAEKYASELRSRGFEAFFHHNDDGGLSAVTVGLFGPTAVDPETGFYAPNVEALLSRFSDRLVNGQPIEIYFDPNNHALGSSVQQPCLVEVPVD